MAKPILTVIAGCNGAGKSSFSNALSPEGTISFDYDKEFLRIYNSQSDSELRELMSHNLARRTLEEGVEQAIFTKSNYTYETNFNSTPLYWPKKFEKAGFRLVLFFFCLDSIDEAKRRVQIRVENNGHFVPEHEIEERYHLGYKNLNDNWSFFDEVHLFNTSRYGIIPQHFLSLIDGKVVASTEIPTFIRSLLFEIPGILVSEA